ncbi:MAG: Holliday junction resolvase RecU [Candidatus Ornithomonoglobus sp.]
MDNTIHMSAADYRGMIRGDNTTDPDGGIETQYRNRCSNDRGHAFENLIVKGCQYYAQRGRAVINKVYEPYRCIKKLEGGKFVGQFTARAEPDFKGVLAGGRAIAFEAKSTRKDRIQQNVLTREQCAWLEEQHRMGALAFVCVEIGGRFFMVPWRTWRDMKQIYGKKYLTAEDMPGLEVMYDGAVRYLDYTDGGRIDEA